MRPIDADNFKEQIKRWCNKYCPYTKKTRETMCSSCPLDSVFYLIDSTPTVNIIKLPVHSRWVSYPHQIDRECSICGHTEPYKFADKEAEIFNFCPHCGADMRKEDPDET